MAENYQDAMKRFQREGKISGAYGDMPVDDSELIRRVMAAKKIGLVKDVEPIEKDPNIKQNFTLDAHNKYIESRPQVRKNTEELMALGVPRETLAPFIQRKSEEGAMMSNLNKLYAPKPGAGTMISSREEKALGLNPENYTTKKWNPQSFIGGRDPNMAGVVGEMKSNRSSLENQKDLLGSSESVNGADREAIKRQMMNKLMGVTEEVTQEDPFTQRQLKAIQELGWEMKNGYPVVDDQDDKVFRQTLNSNRPENQMTARERLMMDALTDWKDEYEE